MKAKFIILFNCNSKRAFYKYKIYRFSDAKLNNINGFNEKIVAIKSIPYSQYLEEEKYIKELNTKKSKRGV